LEVGEDPEVGRVAAVVEVAVEPGVKSTAVARAHGRVSDAGVAPRLHGLVDPAGGARGDPVAFGADLTLRTPQRAARSV
jgi:hypothetical protein